MKTYQKKGLKINTERMKTLLLLILASLSIFNANGQGRNDRQIYEDILKEFDYNRIIQRRTSLKTLRKFNFKKPTTHWEPYSHDSLNLSWRSFLNDIDTSRYHEGNLKSTFLKRYPRRPGDERAFYFSPILFSQDRAMAVCAITMIGTRGSMAEQVFLYEKRNGKWVMLKAYLIAMT